MTVIVVNARFTQELLQLLFFLWLKTSKWACTTILHFLLRKVFETCQVYDRILLICCFYIHIYA